jgi:ABC-2 type transport system permease protein
MKTFKTLFNIEFKLSLRDMNMPIFAIIMPLIIALIIGMIYGNKEAYDGADFTFYQQSFGAIVTIGIAASGLMGLPLVLSDYRRKKILKRFKVTPVSPAMLLMVQFFINATYCLIELLLVYLFSVLFFNFSLSGSYLFFVVYFILVLISIFSIGLFVSAIAKNEKTANLLTTILYFPMLVFSGATLPYEIMPKVMQNISDLMPLTQGIKLLKGVVLNLPVQNTFISLLAIIIIPVILIPLSIKEFKWE